MIEILEHIAYYLGFVVNSFATALLLQCIITVINGKKYSIKNLLLSWSIITPTFIISTIIQAHIPYLNWIKLVLVTIAMLINTYCIYKMNFLKSLFAVFVVVIITTITDNIIAITLLMLGFNIDKLLLNKPVYTIIICLFSSFQIFVALSIKHFFFYKRKIQVKILEVNSKYIIPPFLTLVICLLLSLFTLAINNYKYSMYFILINVIQLIVVSFIGMYNINKAIKHKEAEQEFENTKLYNKSLVVINEQVKGIKHDMGNIVQAINGYLVLKEYDGAIKYCNKILDDFSTVNLLSVLSPNIIDEPSIYGIIARKKYIAEEKGVDLKISVTASCKNICFPLVELTRCIGILLDNGLEASLETEEKKFWIDIRYDCRLKSHVITVGNSVKNPNTIDTVKMFEHGYSTKAVPSGIGLYEIVRFMDKYNKGHIQPEINKENNTFTQELSFELDGDYVVSK